MRIALWGSYGICAYPKGFKPDGGFITSRKNLAEYLETYLTFVQNMVEYSSTEELMDSIYKSDKGCIPLKDEHKSYIHYYVKSDSGLGYWYIKDVDISKFWLLDDYDGAEAVTYYQIDSNNRLVSLPG